MRAPRLAFTPHTALRSPLPAVAGLGLAGLWLLGAISTVALAPTGAQAQQTTPTSTQCAEGTQGASHSATPPAQGSSSGTAPGGSGSTGWSGGTGGSYIGTSNHAATPGAASGQPETVTGVNPGKAETPPKPC